VKKLLYLAPLFCLATLGMSAKADALTLAGSSTKGPNAPQKMFGWTPGSATQEPSSLVLFGSGLLGLAVIARRKVARS
jgi:hypothetical protein